MSSNVTTTIQNTLNINDLRSCGVVIVVILVLFRTMTKNIQLYFLRALKIQQKYNHEAPNYYLRDFISFTLL